MVMEKNGFTEFTIINKDTKNKFTVYPSQYLSIIQEKQMSFQPDMIWQFAHHIKDEFKKKGMKNISITVNAKVALNGNVSKTYIDPKIDLLTITSMDKFIITSLIFERVLGIDFIFGTLIVLKKGIYIFLASALICLDFDST